MASSPYKAGKHFLQIRGPAMCLIVFCGPWIIRQLTTGDQILRKSAPPVWLG